MKTTVLGTLMICSTALGGCGGLVDDPERGAVKQDLSEGEHDLVVGGQKTGITYRLENPPDPVVPELTLVASPIGALTRRFDFTHLGATSVRVTQRATKSGSTGVGALAVNVADRGGPLARLGINPPDPVKGVPARSTFEAYAHGAYARVSPAPGDHALGVAVGRLGQTPLLTVAQGDTPSDGEIIPCVKPGTLDFRVLASNLAMRATITVEGEVVVKVDERGGVVPGTMPRAADPRWTAYDEAKAEPLVIDGLDTGIRSLLEVPPDPGLPALLTLGVGPVKELSRTLAFDGYGELGVAVSEVDPPDPVLPPDPDFPSPLTTTLSDRGGAFARLGANGAFQSLGAGGAQAKVGIIPCVRTFDLALGTAERRAPLAKIGVIPAHATVAPPDPVKISFSITGSNYRVTGTTRLDDARAVVTVQDLRAGATKTYGTSRSWTFAGTR